MTALSLDHVGVIVQDLDAGAARWRALGFQLTPRSPQMGLDASGLRFEPWATANHCAVLERGYIELIGVHRPECPNPWAGFLRRFEGGHIAALRCASADRAYAELARRSTVFQPPVDRRRDAPYGDGTREMRFRNIFSRDELVAEGRYIVIEHQTPEVLWQPSRLEHPNRSRAIERIVFCDDTLAALAARFEALTGAAVRRPLEGLVEAPLPGGGALQALTPAAFAARFPGASRPAGPAIAAVTLTVDDLRSTREWLSAHNVAINATRERVWVGPALANGCVFEFESS